MDDLKMANMEKLAMEIEALLSGGKWSDRIPSEDRDASWELRVADDRLHAWLDVYPSVGKGVAPDTGEILAAIEEAGIRRVDAAKVHAIVEKCRGGSAVVGQDSLIAEGIPPVDPVQGRIEFLVPFEKVKLTDDTQEQNVSIDWKNLWRIPIVHSGDVIARVISPLEGRPGVDVYGTPLPAPCPAPFRVNFGKGVQVSGESGVMEVLTARDIGQPVYMNGMIDVVPVLLVPGDVDIVSGNVEFIGSVIVQGSITEGFSVKAGRDVTIGGFAYNARIDAGGSCIVQGGIVGEHCEIRAGEDIRAGFVEYGILISGMNIEILGYTLFATLEARQSVFVQGKGRRGIIGGSVVAGTTIRALSAGSSMEPRTLLEAGRDALRTAAIEEMTKKQVLLGETLKKIELGILSIKGERKEFDLDHLEEERKQKLFLLASYHKKVNLAAADVSAEIENEKRAMLTERKGSPGIRIRDKVFPNVTVRIWESQVKILSVEFSVGYYFDKQSNSMRKGSY